MTKIQLMELLAGVPDDSTVAVESWVSDGSDDDKYCHRSKVLELEVESDDDGRTTVVLHY